MIEQGILEGYFDCGGDKTAFRIANVREGSIIMRRIRRSLPDREKGKFIEKDNQRYDRKRLCQPQQQKIPRKEHSPGAKLSQRGILQRKYQRRIS